MEQLPTIAILGAGSMGGAILEGLVHDPAGHAGITVTNRSAAKAAAIELPGVRSVALENEEGANRAAAAAANVVLLGVKPHMIIDLCAEIADALQPGTVVVSVAAGVTTRAMEAALGEGVAVIRAMPNTPSHVGLGVTGVAGGESASEADVALAARVFEAVGEVLVIDESQIDALSTISGSGPAYVFLFMEELQRTAERMGFTAEQAATMVQGTFRGASELQASQGIDPAELRRRVTSPNGTTERAIGVLQEANLGAVFDTATAAALARAKELAG